MTYEIKNENFVLKINSLGAEMTSLVYNEKTIIRKVDKWDKIAPVLFPCIGILDDNIVNEKKVPKHGYVRLSEFDVTFKTDSEIEFVNKNNREYFDYDCEFYVKYSLSDDEINVTTRVVNLDSKSFNYSVGHHPAIIVDEKDYQIDFKKSELLFQNDDVLKKELSSLKRCDFKDVDTILVSDLDNLAISFSDYKISFITNDFDTFGIWSNLNPNSDFVCIEPWCGFDLNDNMKLKIKSMESREFDFKMKFETCFK